MTTVPLLEAERLTVRRAGRAVLDDVSMAVAGGDMVASYGPSGSGKSTLLAVPAGPQPLGRAGRSTAVAKRGGRAGDAIQTKGMTDPS
jgi:iron complex transport system ATP-binding protein